MEKEPKLKTKLNFRFDIEEMEGTEFDFLFKEPKEKVKKIKIFKKDKKKKYESKRKSNSELF